MEAREIRKDELDELLDFYRLHTYDVIDEPLPDQGTVEKIWTNIIESENLAALGVFDKGVLMSHCTISVIPNLTRGCRPYALMENIATHRKHRREGYGRALIEYATRYAEVRNCYKVMFMTGHFSDKVEQFCQSVGFASGQKKAFIRRYEY